MVRVYFTELAYLQLLVEVKKYCRVETGAILIGQAIGKDYYVFESLDSGINCRRSSSIFHRDNPYSEHLADVVRAKYTKAYAIGFWHRHPGDFNRFSHTDLEANIDMARVMERDIISGLVNVNDDRVRLRFWQITLGNQYEEAEIFVGNHYFSNLIFYKSISDIERQILMNESGYAYESRRHDSAESRIDDRPTLREDQTKKKKKGRGIVSRLHKRDRPPEEPKDLDMQTHILNTIYDDLRILSLRHIKCEIYRSKTPEQQDKVALLFSNLENNKQCDVLLYFDKGKLKYALQGACAKYEKEALAKEVGFVLGDNDEKSIESV